MTLSILFTLLFAGQWAAMAQAAICPRWSGMDVCAAADTIRGEDSCNYGGTRTGNHRNLNDGPTSEFQNRCICSSGYYSLVMACLNGCRQERVRPFREWVQNCNREHVNNGGIQYSGSVTVPRWAVVTYDNKYPQFDPAVASRAAQPPTQPNPPNAPNPPDPPNPPNPPNQPTTSSSRIPIPPPRPTSNLPSEPPPSTTPANPSVPVWSFNSGSLPSNSDASSGATRVPSTEPVARETDGSTKSINTSDPNAPNFVAPNPSDDPFGLGPSKGSDSNEDGRDTSSPDRPAGATSSPNIGAIVGGIIAGLFAILAAVGFVYFVVLRRRRNRTAPSAAFLAQYGGSTGRITSPHPQTLYSDSRSGSLDLREPVRPESPTLPRRSTDVYVSAPNQHDPFNPSDFPSHPVSMRQTSTPLLPR